VDNALHGSLKLSSVAPLTTLHGVMGILGTNIIKRTPKAMFPKEVGEPERHLARAATVHSSRCSKRFEGKFFPPK
jgi:hypothetical protein